MEDRETARMRKYGESKTTRIMMATVPHVASGLGLRKFQTDGFLLTRVYMFICFVKYMLPRAATANTGVSTLHNSLSYLYHLYQVQYVLSPVIAGTAFN